MKHVSCYKLYSLRRILKALGSASLDRSLGAEKLHLPICNSNTSKSKPTMNPTVEDEHDSHGANTNENGAPIPWSEVSCLLGKVQTASSAIGGKQV